MRVLLITRPFANWNDKPLDLAAGDVLEFFLPALFGAAYKEQG